MEECVEEADQDSSSSALCKRIDRWVFLVIFGDRIFSLALDRAGVGKLNSMVWSVYFMILLGMLLLQEGEGLSSSRQKPMSLSADEICLGGRSKNIFRPHSVSITEFGAVGDGKTLNTLAFQNAVFYLQSFAHKGGAQLYVPSGRWLTGSFSFISHLTLFLDEGAVILASEDPEDWPLIEPLPSYGRGRDLPGSRHRSLLYGKNLEDVVITGWNGTIDGQGSVWWDRFNRNSLNHSRGHLIEFINSKDVLIANITLVNSPFWTIHPVYCSNVVVQSVAIVAPPDSPNTDGIQPDSCSGVCIEDCSIRNGADGVSIKSGWDQYGIEVGIPSENVVIRRVTVETPSSAGIAFGSEMSGGIRNVLVENVRVRNSKTGVELKTAAGRGGYVTNITVTNVVMYNVHTAIGFSGSSDEHPDKNYDPKAYPKIEGIYIRNITGSRISNAGSLEGLEEAPFRDICLWNITLEVDQQGGWACSNVQGFSDSVIPQPCPELPDRRSDGMMLELREVSWRNSRSQ